MGSKTTTGGMAAARLHEGLHRVIRRVAVRANSSAASYIVGHLEAGDQAEAVESRIYKQGHQVRLRIWSWTSGSGISGWVDLLNSAGHKNLKPVMKTANHAPEVPSSAASSGSPQRLMPPLSSPPREKDDWPSLVHLDAEKLIQSKEIEAKWATEKVAAILNWVDTVKCAANEQVQQAITEKNAALETAQANASKIVELEAALQEAQASIDFHILCNQRARNKKHEDVQIKAQERRNRRIRRTCMIAWRTELVRRRKMRQMLMRLQQKEVAQAMCAWHDSVREHRRQVSVVARALARLLKRQLMQCFFGLVDNVASRKRSRKTVLRLLHMRTASVFGTWLAWTVRQRSIQRRMDRVMSRMMLRLAAASFDGWLHCIAAMQQQSATMLRVIGRMARLATSSAFSSWLEHVRLTKKVRRCLARAVRSQLSQSFDRWLEMVHCTRSVAKMRADAYEQSIATVLVRLQYRKVSSSLHRLRNNVASRKRSRKAVLRLLHMRTASVFGTWLAWTVRQRSIQRRMDRVMSRMMLRLAAASFDGWLHCIAAMQQQSATMLRVIGRMARLATSSAFSSWLEHVRLTKKVRRCLARAVRSQLSQSFDRWRCASRTARYNEAAELERERKLQSVVGRWTLGAVGKGFEAWRTELVRRRKMRQMLMRLQQKEVAQAMCAWHDS
eukprot:SAG31_NODE_5293_length_2627_cov_76.347310_1_plen_670_part_01